MPYKITKKNTGICCHFEDSFTVDDLLTLNDNIYSLIDISELQYQLHIFNNVNSFPVTSSAIKLSAQEDAKYYKINPNVKIAIVANKIVMKGLTKVYSTYFELSNSDTTWPIEYFETEEEARNWLNT